LVPFCRRGGGPSFRRHYSFVLSRGAAANAWKSWLRRGLPVTKGRLVSFHFVRHAGPSGPPRRDAIHSRAGAQPAMIGRRLAAISSCQRAARFATAGPHVPRRDGPRASIRVCVYRCVYPMRRRGARANFWPPPDREPRAGRGKMDVASVPGYNQRRGCPRLRPGFAPTTLSPPSCPSCRRGNPVILLPVLPLAPHSSPILLLVPSLPSRARAA
jgi:hypothetical protein